MTTRIIAYSVHLFTGTGAVLAMLALLAAAAEDYSQMFVWLLIALVVDGIDGPLARRYDTERNAAIIDGALLDLIIDYLTYVFVPAFALFNSGLIPGLEGWTALVTITFGSALYFADTRMKTSDFSFSGFPGCWNMVVLVLFATEPAPSLCLSLILALAAAMFLPVKFVHPVRTKRWRRVTLGVCSLWLMAATLCVIGNFTTEAWVVWLLGLTAAYLCFAGVAQQLTERRAGPV